MCRPVTDSRTDQPPFDALDPSPRRKPWRSIPQGLGPSSKRTVWNVRDRPRHVNTEPKRADRRANQDPLQREQPGAKMQPKADRLFGVRNRKEPPYEDFGVPCAYVLN